ncbi:MAG: DUF1796 family putative cysteine peptidase [Candidatus Babeliales bacterium]|nr:DUF1796 family putative cysteine peptidase [Candidatus Babeliales bacterium]
MVIRKILITFSMFLPTVIESQPLLISLGNDCQPTLRLRQFRLRSIAYPLDWVKTNNFDGVCALIEEEFAHYLSPDFLEYRSGDDYVSNNHYDVQFFHDFPTHKNANVAQDGENWGYVESNYLDFLPQIKQKYAPRIKRFFDVLKSTNEVIFFRVRINTYQAKKFVNIMTKKYPHLHYTLVVVHDNTSLNYDWDIPHVRNFYINKYDASVESWFYDQEWLKIFKELHLIKHYRTMNMLNEMEKAIKCCVHCMKDLISSIKSLLHFNNFDLI